jgi:hypothetical protein
LQTSCWHVPGVCIDTGTPIDVKLVPHIPAVQEGFSQSVVVPGHWLADVQAPLLLLVDELAVLDAVVLELEAGPVLEDPVVLLELLVMVPLLVPLLVAELELVVVAAVPPAPPAFARPPPLEALLPEAGAPPDEAEEPGAPPEPTKPVPYTEHDATTKGTPKAATSKVERIGAMVSEALASVELGWRVYATVHELDTNSFCARKELS